MAERDAQSSSSDDDWFDPEELPPSTTHTQTCTIHQASTTTLVQAPQSTQMSVKRSSDLENADHNISTATANHNDVNCNVAQHPNTSAFPAELQAAYKLMQANQNPTQTQAPSHAHPLTAVDTHTRTRTSLSAADSRANGHANARSANAIDKDTGPSYDIDGLPVDITGTSMLSLQNLKLSKLAGNGDGDKSLANDDNNNETSHSKKPGKYNHFFAKNFFMKIHGKNDHDQHSSSSHPHDQHPTSSGDVDEHEYDEKKLNSVLHRVKVKGNTKNKQMSDLRLTQKIENAHKGAIYCMEFSRKGDYLATGGQDGVLRIWTVCGSRADLKRWDTKTAEKSEASKTASVLETVATATTSTANASNDEQEQEGALPMPATAAATTSGNDTNGNATEYDRGSEHEFNFSDVLSVTPYREFTGHRADIIDISWSNGEFVLSASIDRTVMLWHTSRARCLCLFQHSDIVTSVQFHPNEDYLFLSGSFDSRLRLWNILEHRVVDWVQVPTLVTSTTFSVNGKFAIAGLYDGQCFFYSTQGHRLKYVTAIECRNASGKFRKGRKVTGLQYMPPTPPPPPPPAPPSSSSSKYDANDSNNNTTTTAHATSLYAQHRRSYGDKNGHHSHQNMEHGSPELLISTNDSRLRLYNLSNFDMKCKYKGHENTQSQIHARFSPDGRLIICGSEDSNIYVWQVDKSTVDESSSIFQSKKNRQEYYEYFKSNCKLPQVALFAPHRTIHYIHKYRTVINARYREMYRYDEEKVKHIILTADTEGHITIYTNHSHEKDYRYPYGYGYQHQQSYHHPAQGARRNKKKKNK